MAENDESLQGLVEVWQQIYAFSTSMVLKCAVELRIADIIHSQGGPITLKQIASGVTDSPSLNISHLERIMRLLVLKNIFTVHHPSDGGETLYGPTNLSRWMLWDSKPSFVPLLLLGNNPVNIGSWHYLSQCVKDGGVAFKKANGCDVWDFASSDSGYNKLFNDAMSSTVDILMGVFLPAYKDELSSIGSLVDVGGGTGEAIHEIVKSHPHIKGINFDLPHVIATAPAYEGISHIGGSMFEDIPNADAIFIKDMLHDWNDEKCVEILKNCRKAIPEKIGKIIIVENVIGINEKDIFEEIRIMLDLTMMTLTTGKERTIKEWKKLLEEGGFPRYNFIKIPARQSIIEAYPI
nr:xanthohumol 4-O-methyltransferase-like [Ziziphus jujuba var. spinosa]